MINKDSTIAVVQETALRTGVQIKGTTVDNLDSLSRAVELPIPAQLREWLMLCNCAPLGPGGVFGICKGSRHRDMEYLLGVFPAWKEQGWLPVAGDGVGSFYVINTHPTRTLSHPVYFVEESDYERVAYVVASGIWPFIWFYLQEELGDDFWPFDRSRVLRADPALETCTDLKKPWEVE